MPCVGDEIIAGIHYALVGLDNGKALGDTLVLSGIVSAIKALRRFDGTDGGVIGQHQHQTHFGVSLFYFLDCLCYHTVEVAVVAHKEIRHTVFRYMALNLS